MKETQFCLLMMMICIAPHFSELHAQVMGVVWLALAVVWKCLGK